MDENFISEYDDEMLHPDLYESDVDWEYLQANPYAYQLYQAYSLFVRCSPATLILTLLEWKIGSQLTYLLISICGIYLLLSTVTQYYFVYLILTYYSISMLCIYLTKSSSHTGHICALFSFAFIITCQTFMNEIDFTGFRGPLMVGVMKQTSLAFDITNTNFDLTETIAYLANPSTILFGPFTSIEKFRSIGVFPTNIKEILYEILVICAYLFYSMVFLFYSCFVEILPKTSYLIEDYTTAQSFRFGHFFICYLSLSSAILGGFSTNLKTTEWTKVEWPRSMSDIVVVWNYPMHQFLHKYIYAKTRQFGYLIAMMLTFLTSSLLHGFNFQLIAVLLSLGFYAYAESVFRQKLSVYLNACIKSRNCSENCIHSRKSDHPLTIAINLLLTLLNVWHLIYLGMPFDGSGQEYGYSWRHTLNIWSRWTFSSHIVACLELLIAKLLS